MVYRCPQILEIEEKRAQSIRKRKAEQKSEKSESYAQVVANKQPVRRDIQREVKEEASEPNPVKGKKGVLWQKISSLWIKLQNLFWETLESWGSLNV